MVRVFVNGCVEQIMRDTYVEATSKGIIQPAGMPFNLNPKNFGLKGADLEFVVKNRSLIPERLLGLTMPAIKSRSRLYLIVTGCLDV